MVDEIVELEGTDLASVQTSKAGPHVLKQQPQLLLVVGADDLASRASSRTLGTPVSAVAPRSHATDATAPLRVAALAVETAPASCDCPCLRTIAVVAPGLDIAAVRHFCEQRVPPHALHQVRLEVEETRGAVTIVERRAPWREDIGPQWTSLPIARLRHTAKTGAWTLYWRDRNQRWHRYDTIAPTPDILVLLDEIDRDPTGIFWG